MTTTSASSPAPAELAVRIGRGFRPDIEGLRALTVVAVLLYHAEVPFTPGGFIGVDVFFVLSGFLITGLIVREMQETGRVRLAAFWGRRARRLLPAAGLVLFVTGVAGLFLLPTVEHRSAGIDIVAAAVYVANLLFIRTSTDYFAATEIPSPVLHFWSLAVEEQFYIVWPLVMLIVAVILVGVRRGAHATSHRAHLLIPGVLVVLAVIGLVSFALSVWLTSVSQPLAFFLMPTRAWEFVAGALAAVCVTRIARLPQGLRTALSWLGLALLVVGIVILNDSMAFPGVVALIPVVATVLILVGGTGGIGRGPGAFLATGPMQGVGRMSYSLYLWHWPVLVLLSVWLGLTSVPWLLFFTALSCVPAYLAYRYVESPLRTAPIFTRSTGRSLMLGVAASLVGVVGGLLLWQVPVTRAVNTDLPPGPTRPGALAPVPAPAGTLVPSLQAARDDRPPTYGRSHLPVPATTSPECVFGDPAGPVRVALLGDSHAGQWISALDLIGQEQGWRIESFTKTGCPAPVVTPWLTTYKRPYTECDTWRQNVLAAFGGADGPDAVIAASVKPDVLVEADGAQVSGGAEAPVWAAGWRELAASVTATGATLIVVHDTPTMPGDPILCIDRHASDASVCDQPRAAVVPPDSVDVDSVRGLPGVDVVNFDDGICYLDTCPVIRANRIVFRDADHLTASYAAALAPGIAKILDPMVTEAVARKRA